MNWMGKGRNQKSLRLREEKKIKEHFGRKQAEKKEILKEKHKRSSGVSRDLLHLACVSATSRNARSRNKTVKAEPLNGLLEKSIGKSNKRKSINLVSSTSNCLNPQLPPDPDNFAPSKIEINDGSGEIKDNSEEKLNSTVNSIEYFNKGIDDMIFTQSTPLVSQVATNKNKGPHFSSNVVQQENNHFSDMSKLDLISPICNNNQKTNNNQFNNSYSRHDSSFQHTLVKNYESLMPHERVCDMKYEDSSVSHSLDQYDIKLGCEVHSNANIEAKFDFIDCPINQQFRPEELDNAKIGINELSTQYLGYFNKNKCEIDFTSQNSLYKEELNVNYLNREKDNMILFNDDCFPASPTMYSFNQQQNTVENPSTHHYLTSRSMSDESIFVGVKRNVSLTKECSIPQKPTTSPNYFSPARIQLDSYPISYSPIVNNQELYSPGYNNLYPSSSVVHTPSLGSPPGILESKHKNCIEEDRMSQIVPPSLPKITRNIYKEVATSPVKWPTTCRAIQTGQ